MATERSKTTSSKMVSTTVYVDKYQIEALRALKEVTGVPFAAYVRQGVDAVLKNHERELEKVVVFTIWQHEKEGYGILVPDLPKEEAEALRSIGFRLMESMTVSGEKDAQQRFIKWCQSQCPDAKVEHVDFSRLKGE